MRGRGTFSEPLSSGVGGSQELRLQFDWLSRVHFHCFQFAHEFGHVWNIAWRFRTMNAAYWFRYERFVSKFDYYFLKISKFSENLLKHIVYKRWKNSDEVLRQKWQQSEKNKNWEKPKLTVLLVVARNVFGGFAILIAITKWEFNFGNLRISGHTNDSVTWTAIRIAAIKTTQIQNFLRFVTWYSNFQTFPYNSLIP